MASIAAQQRDLVCWVFWVALRLLSLRLQLVSREVHRRPSFHATLEKKGSLYFISFSLKLMLILLYLEVPIFISYFSGDQTQQLMTNSVKYNKNYFLMKTKSSSNPSFVLGSSNLIETIDPLFDTVNPSFCNKFLFFLLFIMLCLNSYYRLLIRRLWRLNLIKNCSLPPWILDIQSSKIIRSTFQSDFGYFSLL